MASSAVFQLSLSVSAAITSYSGNDGKEHEGNEITEFYDPEEAPDISEKQVDSQPAPGQGAGAAASWDAGRF